MRGLRVRCHPLVSPCPVRVKARDSIRVTTRVHMSACEGEILSVQMRLRLMVTTMSRTLPQSRTIPLSPSL